MIGRGARWERQLREEGREPDPRFSFANERTFLAWIRTSLAIMATGLGVDTFATDLPTWGRKVLACGLVVLGGAVAASSFRRWLRSERAIRRAAPLPINRWAPVLAYAVGLGGALALVLMLAAR
jgi:putative membrane protein